MDLPIGSLLKRRSELETAKLEDSVMDLLTGITDRMALHGGTAVWRCYGGKRFSTDIGAYIWDAGVQERFIRGAQKLGIEAAKFREKGVTSMHVRKNGTEISIEQRNVEKNAVLVPYERVDGSKVNILALSAEDMVLEKIAAYDGRRAYKDLYDITVLLNSVKERYTVHEGLADFIAKVPAPDEGVQSYSEFRSVIYAGVVPTYQQMTEFIRRWLM